MLALIKKVRRNLIDSFIYNQHKKCSFNGSIISNDCWGAEFYIRSNIEYNTPFVGLMLYAPCYISFLENFEENLNAALTFTSHTKYKDLQERREEENDFYPIGKIDEIEIHFLHYTSEEEALNKWERRKRRIKKDNLFVKFDCSKDDATLDLVKRFKNLEFQNAVVIGNLTSPKEALRLSKYNKNGKNNYYATFYDYKLLKILTSGQVKRTNLLDRMIYNFTYSIYS